MYYGFFFGSATLTKSGTIFFNHRCSVSFLWNLGEKLLEILQGVWSDIEAIAGVVWNWIAGAAEEVWEFIQNLGEAVKKFFDENFSQAIGLGESIANVGVAA